MRSYVHLLGQDRRNLDRKEVLVGVPAFWIKAPSGAQILNRERMVPKSGTSMILRDSVTIGTHTGVRFISFGE